MRIAYISAGAAGMYCGSCLHDNTLAAELTRQGHDVMLVPTYTPMRTDDIDVSSKEMFFGAIGVYLRMKSPLYRHAPRAFDWLLDRPRLLDRLSKLGASTSAADLGGLTLSVLDGEAGPQRHELARLTAWLQAEFQPEIVHLTNSMFLGFARSMRATLDVPVVCSLQGEDLFLDALEEPHKSTVLERLRERARDVDRLIAPSRYYAETMAEYLQVPADSIHTARLGVRLDGHAETRDRDASRPLTLGYLARIAPEKGLHLLVEAFIELAKDDDQVELHVAGYLGPGDRPYFEEIVERVADAGLRGRFHHRGEVDRAAKLQLLAQIDLLVQPTVYREAKGLSVIEAMASGVPVIVPNHGSFPELIEATGGGVLIEPGSSEAIVVAVRALAAAPEECRALAERGRKAVHTAFDDRAMARETVELYRQALSAFRS